MRKTLNRENIAGRIYDINLEKKVTGPSSKVPGTQYIAGDIDIATDEDALNIVTVHYSYVTETTSKGNADKRYPVLANLIENAKTIVADGKENATIVKVGGSTLSLNEFFTENAKTEKNPDGLVSSKRNEGGFISIVSKLNEKDDRNTFECDMFITNAKTIQADPDNNIPKDYLVLKGIIFDYTGAILPMDFTVRSEGGIKYFESLDISDKNPVFTKVWGNIESQTIVRTYEEESSFGEPVVKESTRTIREWTVTGAAKEPYEIGDSENGVTKEEIVAKTQDRNKKLAEQKTRAEEYRASKENASTPVAASNSDISFNF